MPLTAAGGKVCSALSATTRNTANGSPCSVAIRATTWLSMSTISAPVVWQSAAFAPISPTACDEPKTTPRRASGIAMDRRLDHALSAANFCASLKTAVATMHVPDSSPGRKAPAIPKLMIPRAPSSMARSIDATSRVSSPPPATAFTSDERSATIASALRPVAATTKPRACTAHIPTRTDWVFAAFRLR